MPDTPSDDAKTVTLGFRVTETEKVKLKRLAAMRDVPYADLLREKVDELIAEHDRAVEMFGSVDPA